jgi:cyclin K
VQQVQRILNVILLTEEALLETLCFDFFVPSPHAELVGLFEAHEVNFRTQEHAWSIAHDSSVDLLAHL